MRDRFAARAYRVPATRCHRAWSIQHDLLDRGERIGARDVLIAGTALGSTNPRVLTRNASEFERVEGLDVESY